MKTFTKTISLLLIAILFSTVLFANNFENEEYIDDIPFNTNEIAAQSLYQQAISTEFFMEDEEYIDDIPFNTKEIACECLGNQKLFTDYSMEIKSTPENNSLSHFSIACNCFTKLWLIIVNYGSMLG